MWQYVVLVSVLISLWFYIVIITKYNVAQKTSIELAIIDRNNYIVKTNGSEVFMISDKKISRKKIHVPKFMLDLYEKSIKSKNVNYSFPDIVRSVVPKKAGNIL